MHSVVITGIGMVSASGMSVAETLESLLMERTGIASGMRYCESALSDVYPVGEVSRSNAELAAGLPAGTYSRTFLLALHACREALDHAGIAGEDCSALISGTTVGGMDLTERYLAARKTGGGDIMTLLQHDCGESTNALAHHLGVQGRVATVSTACSSSLNAIMQAARMVATGRAGRAIAGGADCLTRFTLNGFASLKILDTGLCLPFDGDRKGLNLGEGAAFLVLESLESARARGATVLARIAGSSNACDAFHQTAMSDAGDGPMLCMRGALIAAGLPPSAIGYVNLHGTGTQNNDAAEARALEAVFSTVPPCSSTKTYTGHTLGAAGAIEAVITVLALQHDTVFAHLRHRTPMNGSSVVPCTLTKKAAGLRYAMTNSFGFGGNCSSLILERV